MFVKIPIVMALNSQSELGEALAAQDFHRIALLQESN
jgi:hypothetical protein